MAFLVSPGVQVREIDLTNVVPAVQTTIGAIGGPFEKGPVSSVTTIGSEEELVKVFWFVMTNITLIVIILNQVMDRLHQMIGMQDQQAHGEIH